jgi:hypothetical protein
MQRQGLFKALHERGGRIPIDAPEFAMDLEQGRDYLVTEKEPLSVYFFN